MGYFTTVDWGKTGLYYFGYVFVRHSTFETSTATFQVETQPSVLGVMAARERQKEHRGEIVTTSKNTNLRDTFHYQSLRHSFIGRMEDAKHSATASKMECGSLGRKIHINRMILHYETPTAGR